MGEEVKAKKKIRKGPKVVGMVVITILVIVGVVAGSIWAVNEIGYVSTDDSSIDGKTIKLSSRVLGRISAIEVTEGERVTAGQTLVTLDSTDLKAQEAQAQASLAYARQNLVLARVNLEKAEEDFARVEGLFKESATTRESYEHAKSALEASRAQYTLSQASVDTSSAQLGVIEASLLNTKLASPIPGVVDRISLVVGDVAQPGQSILTVNNLDEVWVIANLEETKIGRIAVGANVDITVDAYKNLKFRGKVDMIRSGIVAPSFQIGEFTKTTQRIPVKIVLTECPPNAKLVPGMSVEVKIRSTSSLPSFLDK